MRCLCLLAALVRELLSTVSLFLRSSVALRAEVVFLRKQLAGYAERGVRPRHLAGSDKVVMALASRLFAWRDALVVVRPRTLLTWQRSIGAMFWRWKSRPRGRPSTRDEIRAIVRKLAAENVSWSTRRIANEMFVKFGIRIAPNTVKKYLSPTDPRRSGRGRGDQSWAAFMRNHAKAIAACDFAVSMRIGFEILYIFVVMETGSRRILHINVTAHPTAEWTAQQIRTAVPGGTAIRYLVHDGGGMFNSSFRAAVRRLGIEPLRTPPESPKANAFCERLIGTMRRECLDWIIAISENQLRLLLREWAAHYNRGRPHMSLGPGLPDPPGDLPVPLCEPRHHLPGARIVSTPILGGLHHDYRLDTAA